jgi:hypothetical protein
MDQNVAAAQGNYSTHRMEHPRGRMKNYAVGYMSTVIHPLQIT